MSTFETAMWMLLGVISVLSFGWLMWNGTLLYYRLWCWWTYKVKGRKRAKNSNGRK